MKTMKTIPKNMPQHRNTKTDTELYIRGHYKWYVAGLLMALVVFAWSAAAAHTHVIPGWESRLFFDINHWSNRPEHLFVLVSLFGGSVWAAVGGVVITFCMRMYRLCWRMSASVIGAYVIAFLAKHFIDRARPEELLHEVHVRVTETGMGFPSGHATIATVVSLTILPYLPNRWRWLPPLWIVAVMVSRLYLGVHLPLDVLGGLCVGVLVVACIRVMPQPLRVFLRLD